jgi:hypothetical protein
MRTSSKTTLDPVQFCREVQLCFGPNHEFYSTSGKIINDFQTRTNLSASQSEKLGAEIQRETLQLVNSVKAVLPTKEFQEIILKSQRKSPESPRGGSSKRRSSSTHSNLTAALGGKTLAAPALAQAVLLVEKWLDGFIRRAKFFCDLRGGSGDQGGQPLKTDVEEYLFRKEELAAMFPLRLAGTEPKSQMPQEDLAVLLQAEGQNFLRTNLMLKKLEFKDILNVLKDGVDVASELEVKFTAIVAGRVAEAEFKNRLPSLVYCLLGSMMESVWS